MGGGRHDCAGMTTVFVGMVILVVPKKLLSSGVKLGGLSSLEAAVVVTVESAATATAGLSSSEVSIGASSVTGAISLVMSTSAAVLVLSAVGDGAMSSDGPELDVAVRPTSAGKGSLVVVAGALEFSVADSTAASGAPDEPWSMLVEAGAVAFGVACRRALAVHLRWLGSGASSRT